MRPDRDQERWADPALEALLDAERGAGAMPAATRSRLLASISRDVLTVAAVGTAAAVTQALSAPAATGAATAATSSGTAAGTTAAASTAAGGAATGATAAATGTAAASSGATAAGAAAGAWKAAAVVKVALAVGAASFVAGGVAGVGGDRMLNRPAPVEIAAPQRVAPAPPTLPEPEPEPEPVIEPQVVAPPAPALNRAAKASLKPTPPAEANDELGDERSLVEQARTALGRGSPADALTALSAHERRYPRGQLAEERLAMQVLTLTSLGRHDEARARAEEFRARFPNGLFRSAVDSAVR